MIVWRSRVMNAEPAGVWVRVSTGGQDEQNQVPDVERYCEAHDYRIAKRYELHDKSASKGEQQDTLDAMLTDMREGTIKVLVCWHSDRLERRGPEYVFPMLANVRDAGGRIESTQEPLFGQQDFAGQVSTAVNSSISFEKSKRISEQVKLAHNRSRANEAIYAGTPLFGFTIEGPKYGKKYVPTELGRSIAPQIFERCIAGHSLRQIAEWLDSQEITPQRGGSKWNEAVVRRIIRNRAYAGRVINREGVTISHCEAIVSPDTWDRANHALKTRPKRGPTNANNRPLLAKLKCNRCGAPMYRRAGGHRGRYVYYACSGSGPQRKGCGNVVAYDHAEIIVAVRIFMTSTEPHQTRHWVEGENWDSEISDVMLDIRELPQKIDPLSPDFPSAQAKLFGKLADYRNRETVPGHWEFEDTGMTVGEHFDTLDRDGQREYLKTRDIKVEFAVPELEPGATHGLRVVIDGEDHGVFPYPPPRVTLAKH
jgi:site-specific DNA recombinase